MVVVAAASGIAGCLPVAPPPPPPAPRIVVTPGTAHYLAPPHPFVFHRPSKVFTVENVGNAPTLPMIVASLGGGYRGPGSFGAWPDACTGTVLAPGDRCEVTIHYEDTTGGGNTSQAKFGFFGAGMETVITVTGEGVPGGLEVDVEQEAFIDTPDIPFDLATFTVKNNGLSTITGIGATIGDATGAGDFWIWDSDCTTLVPYAGTGVHECIVRVAYQNDTTTGTGTATLVVAGDSGSVARAHLQGTGDDEPLDLDPHEADLFAPLGVPSAPQVFMLTNHGTEATGALDVSLGLRFGSGDFGIVNDECSGLSLAGSESCTFAIRYTNGWGSTTAWSSVVVEDVDGPGGIVAALLFGERTSSS